MRLAEHLTVVGCRRATLAPCGDMVSVHILETPYPILVLALTEGASWTIGDPARLSLLRLTLVGTPLSCVVEETYLQQLRLHLAPEQILGDILLPTHRLVRQQLCQPSVYLVVVIRSIVIGLVEPAPSHPSEVRHQDIEERLRPSDHTIKVTLQLRDPLIVAMCRHILSDFPLAHPVQGGGEEVLTLHIPPDVVLPLLDAGVAAIAEDLASCGHEGTRVDRIQQLLIIERDAGDIDRLKPLADLALRPLAYIDKEWGLQDLPLLILCQSAKGKGDLIRSEVDAKLSIDKPPQRGNPLLTVQHLQLTVLPLVEVDQPDRIALEDRLDDRKILLAVTVDIVALVLRLYQKFSKGVVPGSGIPAPPKVPKSLAHGEPRRSFLPRDWSPRPRHSGVTH